MASSPIRPPVGRAGRRGRGATHSMVQGHQGNRDRISDFAVGVFDLAERASDGRASGHPRHASQPAGAGLGWIIPAPRAGAGRRRTRFRTDPMRPAAWISSPDRAGAQGHGGNARTFRAADPFPVSPGVRGPGLASEPIDQGAPEGSTRLVEEPPGRCGAAARKLGCRTKRVIGPMSHSASRARSPVSPWQKTRRTNDRRLRRSRRWPRYRVGGSRPRCVEGARSHPPARRPAPQPTCTSSRCPAW